jgi:predicted negative regulator of RcsB-dependent stress response
MGFSFAKLFLLLLVLAVVWFGWRYFRIREKEAEIAAERMRQGGVVKAALKEEAETMAPCRACKTYISPKSAPCARADCPQR